MAKLGSTTIYGDLNVTGDVPHIEFGDNKLYISDTEPTDASQGDIWIDNTEAFQ